MAAFTYTAKRGLSLLGNEKGAWMADTTAGTLVEVVDTLNGAIGTTDTTITVNDTIGFTSSGSIVIESETIDYTGLTSTTFTGCTRGVNGSTAATHSDGITVRLLNAKDLSTNNNGLGVYGSITKSAVATGTDLMAYSGFSSSNYLEQPYNSDLDFGTGDFCFMGWIKQSYNQSSEIIFIRRKTDNTGEFVDMYVNSAGVLVYQTSSVEINTGITINDSVARHVVAFRKSGISYVYVNGALAGSITDASNQTISGATLLFGVSHQNTTSLSNGELSLWRILSYAPTVAQIKTIYDKEKHLFEKYSTYTQEGQQYSFDIVLSSANQSITTRKNTVTTLSGKAQSVVHRDDTDWLLSTDFIHRTDTSYVRVSEMTEFLYSTSGSEQFTLDLYGTVASPDEPTLFYRPDNSYQFNRVAEQMLFTASFKARKL